MLKQKKSIAAESEDRVHPVDRHVGARVKMRRNLLGMSMAQLADGCGLTFQQIQKYEKGRTRISASRLYQFSELLDVSVSYFFDGYASRKSNASKLKSNDLLFNAMKLDTSVFRLLRAYQAIPDKKIQKKVIELAQSLQGSMRSK